MSLTSNTSKIRALIIGGGFYGINIALYLAAQNKGDIVLLEKETGLLTRASYNNQARIHNGYHYPRSFTTAYRSRINFPRFIDDWPSAVKKDFTSLYAIAKKNSKVTSNQFERFCQEIGAKIERSKDHLDLFNNQLIDSVFLTEEYVFDVNKLEEWAIDHLEKAHVNSIFNSSVIAVNKLKSGLIETKYMINNEVMSFTSEFVFNCTYSGINQIQGDFNGTLTKLKHEITEMALIEIPEKLKDISITVMDGPFFSLMPFPAKDAHTLSHVRYTPHLSWNDEQGDDPYLRLEHYKKFSRADRMIRDAQRYLPDISLSKYVSSLFEVKTILVKNENDDGRPILFESSADIPNFYSILGGKIDNIYDALENLTNNNI